MAQAAAAERERAAQAERAERERAAKTAALAKLRGWRETLQPLLRKPIPGNVRTPLVALVTEIEVAERSGAFGDIPRIEAKFVQAQPTIEAAQTLARVLTDKNRFVEGDRDDIVFIYNASPKAPSVTKDLSGKFVFDLDRTAACFLHNPVADRLTLRLLRDKAAALGAPLKFPLARCAPDQLQKQDVLVFQRDPFVGQPINFVATVASAVDAGVFASMAILPGSELKTAAQAEAEAVRELKLWWSKACRVALDSSSQVPRHAPSATSSQAGLRDSMTAFFNHIETNLPRSSRS